MTLADWANWATIACLIVAIVGLPAAWRAFRHKKGLALGDGRGGRGGGGTIEGDRGVILGGRGGEGGPTGAGRGGDGGSGHIKGDGGLIVGGDGGEAGQLGRGGLGGSSPFERLGLGDVRLPDGRKLSDFGRGGDGGAPPITHGGNLYVLALLVRQFPPEKIKEIDQTNPISAQEWWNRAVLRWPDFADAAVRNSPRAE